MTDHPLLTRTRPETCLSDLALDRLRFDELPPDEASLARAHLADCAACTRRHEELEAADHTPEPLVAPARSRPRPARRLHWLAVGSLAAAAALMLVVRPEGAPSERRKGKAALGVWVRHRDGRVAPVLPGDELAAGEAIRFELSPERPSFVAVLGLDAASRVTAYVPTEGPMPKLPAQPRQQLPGSIVLDETPGVERLVALFCPRELAMESVLQAGRRALAQAAGAPARVDDLGLGCQQATLLFTKATSR